MHKDTNSSNHGKKMIAPIIVTLLICLYVFMYLAIVIILDCPLMFSIPFGIILALIVFASIYVLVERIREIRNGEEDDISKY